MVELKPGCHVSAEQLIARCREVLGSIRAPKEVVFVEQLPRSVNGKVLKKDIRAQFWATSGRAI